MLDGVDLGWDSKSGIGFDRWHYDIYRNESLSSGEHDLEYILGDEAITGKAQLCSAEIIEFGNADEQVHHY